MYQGVVSQLWVYLSASPLLWLTLTVGAFLGARKVAEAGGNHPLLNPVLLAISALVGLLWVTGTPYPVYFAGAQFVHFALGPATVALAVPLYRNRHAVRQTILPILASLVAGSAFAVLSVTGLALAFGVPSGVVAAMAPKSVTAGIAMGIANQVGADPALTAVFVIATGIIGAVTVTPLMDRLGVRDYAARGFAAGLASHGIGTARALQVDDVAGAFAGLAMALNGLATALLAPLILHLFR